MIWGILRSTPFIMLADCEGKLWYLLVLARLIVSIALQTTLDYREEEKKKVVVTVFETISFGLGHKEERVCSRMSHQDMRLCDC